MLEALLLLAAVAAWPPQCDVVGQVYLEAATIRQKGIPLEEALYIYDAQQTVQNALRHVYARKDMSPEAWRYYAIGVCHGSMEKRDRNYIMTTSIGPTDVNAVDALNPLRWDHTVLPVTAGRAPETVTGY